TLLEADGAGHWLAAGKPARHLDGCLDVDLEASAMTNALLVRRMGLPVGAQQAAPAAYVRAADLAVERLEHTHVTNGPASTRPPVVRLPGAAGLRGVRHSSSPARGSPPVPVGRPGVRPLARDRPAAPATCGVKTNSRRLPQAVWWCRRVRRFLPPRLVCGS